MKQTTNTFALVLAVAMATLAIGCGGRAESAGDQGVITVVSDTVANAAVADVIAMSGNIEGATTVKSGFMVAGRIATVAYEEGDVVRKGALLAELDSTNYSIARDLARVQVSQATDEHDRLQLMHDRGSVSESDYRKSCFALEGAQAQLRLREKDLADTRLYSPIAGLLLKKMAEMGEIVAAGQPILVVADIATVNVLAYIPENRLHEIAIGQSATVAIAAIGATVEGTVAEVGGMADPQTRAFTVKVRVANTDMKIRPGMIADVRVCSSASRRMPTIPAKSVMSTPDGQPYVYVIDGELSKAFRRDIALGDAVDDRIAVVSGLECGETIVVGGQQKLTNGTKVKLATSHP